VHFVADRFCRADTGLVIFIVISIDVRPERREDFLAGITGYCAQVREEPGARHFSCYEDVEHSNRFVVVANYADQAAGEAHVASEHAQWFFGWLPSVVTRVPRIVYQELPGEGWSEMSEVRLDEA
jgi:quinol monooxygenase YgiN